MYTCIIPSAITIVYDYCLTILTDEEQSHPYHTTIPAFIVHLACLFLALGSFFFPFCASNIKPFSFIGGHLSFLGTTVGLWEIL
jgi:hypothetical protein